MGLVYAHVHDVLCWLLRSADRKVHFPVCPVKIKVGCDEDGDGQRDGEDRVH